MSKSDFDHLDRLDRELQQLKRGSHGYAAGLHRIAQLMQDVAGRSHEDPVPAVRQKDADEASFRAWDASGDMSDVGHLCTDHGRCAEATRGTGSHDEASRLHDEHAYRDLHGHGRDEELDDGVAS